LQNIPGIISSSGYESNEEGTTLHEDADKPASPAPMMEAEVSTTKLSAIFPKPEAYECV